MRRTRRLFAALVLAAGASLPLTACSDGLDPHSPAAIAGLAEDAPASQATILRDGQVSDTEYEQAIAADRDCVAAAGYEPSQLSWDDGQLGFTVTASYEDAADPEAADQAFLGATDRCREEHSTLVATVWAAQD